MVCAKNSAGLTPTVSKASAGALELSTVHNVKNMMRFLSSCSEQGYTVMGTSLDDGSLPLGQASVRGPTVLVLGNEGHGLRTNVKRACDMQVKIEGLMMQPTADAEEGGGGGGRRADAGVDSLNVSVTGGILMHFLQQATRQAQQHPPPQQ